MIFEDLNQWHFVFSAYGLGIGSTLAMVIWSWVTMKRGRAPAR